MRPRWAGLCLLLLMIPVSAQDLLDRQTPLQNNEANRLYEQGKYEEALQKYQELYEQNPYDPVVAYNLGNTYAKMGEAEKADEFYNKAMRGADDEAQKRARFNKGNMHMRGEQFEDAIKSYVDYLRRNPDDIDAKRNLELALRGLKQQQQQQQQQQQENQEQQQQQTDQSEQAPQPNLPHQEQEQQEKAKQEKGQQIEENTPQGQQQGMEDEDKLPDEARKLEEEDESRPDRPEDQKEKDIDEWKDQIFEALAEQEKQQQKDYQKRKIGKHPPKAKDW
ncbi:tetratricopeptide repeat protein [Acanthopleuribacter pedis]|uniref:Tetratricopeptide repeat protein n=1 Tax=Acanthopleuribacter pedis TaxID=442870 RepID=A0A8J7U885_9BACT|nr:tetratricopeptide repeat protein [Acanthopleuribacter pedis]MBO1323308.1 tetratricopeptide repeat protein [Acanthopleuribacter pedis]